MGLTLKYQSVNDAALIALQKLCEGYLQNLAEIKALLNSIQNTIKGNHTEILLSLRLMFLVILDTSENDVSDIV